jgi:hypothetical protein
MKNNEAGTSHLWIYKNSYYIYIWIDIMLLGLTSDLYFSLKRFY